MRDKPIDVVESVDNALRLLHLLHEQGRVTVRGAADALGISTSAAHRLLATMAHRDFAARDEKRRYVAGPALSLRPSAPRPIGELRRVMRPAMVELSRVHDETVSLGVLVSGSVRILETTQSRQILRIGDQEGTVLPAPKSAIGRVLLADAESRSASGTAGMSRENARRIRDGGFAVNHGEAEKGVSAVSVPVSDGLGRTLAGLAIVLPSVRYRGADVPEYVRSLQLAVDEVRERLNALDPGQQ